MKKLIADELRLGIREQGSELTTDDIGRYIGGFGRVLPIDVGKSVWLKDHGFVIENNEQRDKRKPGFKRDEPREPFLFNTSWVMQVKVDDEWKDVRPTAGEVYRYKAEGDAYAMLRICYPDSCREVRLGADNEDVGVRVRASNLPPNQDWERPSYQEGS